MTHPPKRSEILWIERKGDGLSGPARIGRGKWSKSRRSLHYRGRTLQSLGGQGFKANYFDVETNEHYWVSGVRKDGRDALYNTDVQIDEDVRVEYWCEVRGLPDQVECRAFRARGKHS